jgi:hypothetical protein
MVDRGFSPSAIIAGYAGFQKADKTLVFPAFLLIPASSPATFGRGLQTIVILSNLSQQPPTGRAELNLNCRSPQPALKFDARNT